MIQDTDKVEKFHKYGIKVSYEWFKIYVLIKNSKGSD